MVPIEPPTRWIAGLEQARQNKDDVFLNTRDSPLLPRDIPSFEGLSYWEPDRRYYFAGTVSVYREAQQTQIVTTTGELRPCEKYGWIRFPIDGQPQTLQVYRLLDVAPAPDAAGMLIAFTDGTSGKETYPAARYVDLEGPPGGPYVLDFNRAYHPLCAYGDPERFACPAAPAENRLTVRIEAGERGYKGS